MTKNEKISLGDDFCLKLTKHVDYAQTIQSITDYNLESDDRIIFLNNGSNERNTKMETLLLDERKIGFSALKKALAGATNEKIHINPNSFFQRIVDVIKMILGMYFRNTMKISSIVWDLAKDEVDGIVGKCAFGECPICLEPMISDSDEILILKCDHIYHNSCLSSHMERNDLCPLCRNIIEISKKIPKTNTDLL